MCIPINKLPWCGGINIYSLSLFSVYRRLPLWSLQPGLTPDLFLAKRGKGEVSSLLSLGTRKEQQLPREVTRTSSVVIMKSFWVRIAQVVNRIRRLKRKWKMKSVLQTCSELKRIPASERADKEGGRQKAMQNGSVWEVRSVIIYLLFSLKKGYFSVWHTTAQHSKTHGFLPYIWPDPP